MTPPPAGNRAPTLTPEQLVASASETPHVFIEAGPGSGKTRIAAQRFGAQRFSPSRALDSRSVVAVSFTRAATWELRQRVLRVWGPSALVWPHRIVTLDTIICELLHDLLYARLIIWPNGHQILQVEDSWNMLAPATWCRDEYSLVLNAGIITLRTLRTVEAAQRNPVPAIKQLVDGGICTHGDVRDVLEQALSDDKLKAYASERLASRIRALIVDEVFDANDLDLSLIELAIDAGLHVTLVGDPWQALYVFRGADPEAVLELIERKQATTYALTESFRWSTPAQRKLADDLRQGRGVTLARPELDGTTAEVDVVLGLRWKQLWSAGERILPLAFSSPKGTAEEAAATLLLNHETRRAFGLDATYLHDSLIRLAITDGDMTRQLQERLQDILEILCTPEKGSAKAAYEKLAILIKSVSPRPLRPVHANYTARLDLIRSHIMHTGQPILGLTAHQAKGREWDRVAVQLLSPEREALLNGLNVEVERDRKLYVACTRARISTIEASGMSA